MAESRQRDSWTPAGMLMRRLEQAATVEKDVATKWHEVSTPEFRRELTAEAARIANHVIMRQMRINTPQIQDMIEKSVQSMVAKHVYPITKGLPVPEPEVPKKVPLFKQKKRIRNAASSKDGFLFDVGDK